MEFANVWRIEAGLVVRYTTYSSVHEALEAVGVSG
jgi:hypothetical protein